MKKLYSILLAVALVFSMATQVVFVQAQATATENTYIASNTMYSNGYGKAYVERELVNTDSDNPDVVEFASKLIYEDVNGQKTVLKSFIDKTNAPYLALYIRGKTVYYAVSGAQNAADGIYSIKSNGSGETLLLNECDILLGGYGAMPIVKNANSLYKITNGQKVKIASLQKDTSGIVLFNGKLYFENKAYNIDTGKTKTFTVKTAVATKQYMYYISGSDNLVMYDKQDNKTYLAKNVCDVLGGNDNKNVVFAKKNSKGETTFYRSSSTNRIYTLATYTQLRKTAKFDNVNVAYTSSAATAKFVNGKAVFLLKGNENTFVQIKNTGGTTEFLRSCGKVPASGVNYNRSVFETVGKKIYFKYSDSEGESTFYTNLDIK